MKRSFRSFVSLILAAFMLLGATAVSAEGPVVYDTPQSFTLWCPMAKAAGAVADWSENLVYQTMKDLTNVSVDFLHPPVGGEKDAFNLMCASGDLPDAIQYGWLGVPGGPANYINDGIIIPLNDLIAEHAPNLTAYLEAHPDLKRQCMLDDGTYYTLPAFYADRELAVSQGPVVRADFLDEIGMTPEDFPTTVAGWEEMLIKVTQSEALEGVIPFLFAKMEEITACPVVLGAYGIAQEFYNDNGTVKFGVLQPEYKEYLSVMRRWFDLGLLDVEFAANTAKLRDEKVTSDRVFCFIGSMGNSITRYTAMCRDANPDFQLLPEPFPTLTEGETPVIGQEGAAYTGGIAITSTCENPEMIVKFYDYFFSEEGHMLSNWGVQGLTYDYDADGKPYFLPLVAENPDGLSREQAMAKYTIWQSTSPVYKQKDVLEQRDRLPEQIEGRKNWLACENEILMPPVTPTMEEASEFATIMNDVQTYYWEQATKIIMGEVDLDEGYDAMVATLKGMGIDRATELRQAALDRYLARP